MTKRYYQRDFEELYYIIDSEVISEKDFDEKYMYDGLSAFEDSLNGEEIVELLNENEDLKRKNEWLINRMSELVVYLSELGYDVSLADDEGNEVCLND